MPTIAAPCIAPPTVKRRTFLVAGLASTGALLFGWSVMPPRQRLVGAAKPYAPDGAVVLNGYVAIAPADTVTVFVPKAEMGQGVHTAIAMLLAEELDCEWSRVRVEHAPVDRIYANLTVARDAVPLHPDDHAGLLRTVGWFSDKIMREVGGMITGGSTSVRDLWNPVRDAGALARATLVQAAAREWDVATDACTVAHGVIRSGERSMRFGELVQGVTELEPATRYTRKAPERYSLIGRSTARLESAAKSDGRAIFGIDVRVDDMLYAAITMAPVIGGTVVSMNADAVAALPGIEAVVLVRPLHGSPHGVAVVANSWYTAQQCLPKLGVEWHDGPNSALSSEAIRAQLRAQAAEPDGRSFRSTGNVNDALALAGKSITVTYDVPYLAHTTMEPPNCTVRLNADSADVWVGTQVPTQARAAVAGILGVDASRVTMHVQLLGGGFGRRLDIDFIAQTAQIARAVPGRAVQLIWSRSDDVQHDFYRPACCSIMTGVLDSEGHVLAIRASSASQSIVGAYGARNGVAAAKFDLHKATVEGMFDQPYAIPSLEVSHHVVELPVPIGFWRAVGHSHQAFFMECFIDELAYAGGNDPVTLRRQLLAHHPRALRVLELAAERSQWSSKPKLAPDGARVARGVALHRSFGAIVAQVAEISLGPARDIRVHRVTCAVDCGLAINPDGVAQQMESGVVYGLTAALYGDITIANGRVSQRNYDSYKSLRLHESPVVETHIVPSMEPPEGIGETGLPPVAPAVANALFALTGERARQLPLRVNANESMP